MMSDAVSYVNEPCSMSMMKKSRPALSRIMPTAGFRISATMQPHTTLSCASSVLTLFVLFIARFPCCTAHGRAGPYGGRYGITPGHRAVRAGLLSLMTLKSPRAPASVWLGHGKDFLPGRTGADRL